MDRLFGKEFTLDRTIRIVFIGLIAWGVIELIDRLSGVLLPFVVALVLALLLDPVVSFIQKRVRNNRGVALFLTFLLILILNAAFYAILIPSVIHEVDQFQTVFEENKDGVFSGDFIPEHLRIKLKDFFQGEEFQSFFTMESLSPMIQKALPGVWSSVTNVFGILGSLIGLIAVLLYLIFILKDYTAIKKNWDSYLPSGIRNQTVEFVNEFNSNMFGYFRQKQ